MSETFKIVVVDDHHILIEGLKLIFNSLENVEVVGSFNTGKEIVEYKNIDKVDIVFLDIFLPDCNGIELCLKLKKNNPKLKIIALTSQSERGIILQLMKNGADGYMLKSANIEDFKNAFDGINNGELVFCNEVKKLMDKVSDYEIKKIPSITRREKEIITLLKKGKSTQEISDELFLSFLTVQTHRRNLLQKFQVNNVVELINVLSENGLI